MDTCPTVRVMPTSEEQGAYVVINESDFDEKVHVLYTEPEPKVEKPAAAAKKG